MKRASRFLNELGVRDVESDDAVELAFPPRFAVGERVIARAVIRNDGTYNGKAMGELLVSQGDAGYVTAIGTFLQRFYVYAVHFFEGDRRVGMRAKELCTLDRLPQDVLAQLGRRADALRWIGSWHADMEKENCAQMPTLSAERISEPFDDGGLP
ncbi:nitrogen fixation protein NifZ [Paraburkholderia unamae]|uniref:Nitrogen fixation protein NifZ n=1 Tax=Paraburkholderia unamae TaxID=219649 RepID=A0ACC6RXG2_9BURK